MHEGKNNGLIVDYCGILKNLRKALATFAGHGDTSRPGAGGLTPQVDPTRPPEELLSELEEAIAHVRTALAEHSVRLEDIEERTGFDRNGAIRDVKEAVNESDETRKRFEIMAREVFKKFKACLTFDGVRAYRGPTDAISIVYKSLQQDVERADVTDIIRELHRIVDEAVEPAPERTEDPKRPYDISKIDFDRLRQEFERVQIKNTTIQTLKAVIQQKLDRMMQRNPLRTDLQRRYEEIIDGYNQEKDRVTIEQTFEELLKLVESLDEEEQRAVKEGLNEESLALYDLLLKPSLSKPEIEHIKKVAADLIVAIHVELEQIADWRAKQATRDAIRTAIHNFLYDEATGLPYPTYDEHDIEETTEKVYLHVFRVYDTAVPSIYTDAA